MHSFDHLLCKSICITLLHPPHFSDNVLLISRVKRLHALILYLLPLNMIWLARIVPHVALAWLLLFLCGSSGLVGIAYGRLQTLGVLLALWQALRASA